MMNLQMKRKMTLHQRRYFSEPSAWRLPGNMNIEIGGVYAVAETDQRTIFLLTEFE
jgi:hypothetical protein